MKSGGYVERFDSKRRIAAQGRLFASAANVLAVFVMLVPIALMLVMHVIRLVAMVLVPIAFMLLMRVCCARHNALHFLVHSGRESIFQQEYVPLAQFLILNI